jgi:hypothetical protein
MVRLAVTISAALGRVLPLEALVLLSPMKERLLLLQLQVTRAFLAPILPSLL